MNFPESNNTYDSLTALQFLLFLTYVYFFKTICNPPSLPTNGL